MLRVRMLVLGALCVSWIGSLPSSAADVVLRDGIDAQVRAAWQREKITPAATADDATFLRRIYLDLVGAIPTFEEATAFLRDTDPRKRATLIDKLLADPRFGVHQANVWDLLLFGRNPPGGDTTRNRDGFRQWLAGKFAQNEPYDRLVQALLLAEEDQSGLFYAQYRNQPEETTVAVSRLFLGTQLQCARCHDHPYETWTQRDFYGMASFFARLVVVDGGGTGKGKKMVIGEKSTGDVHFSGSAKDQRPGKKGEPIPAKFLGGVALDEPPLPKDFKEPDLKGNKAPPKPAFSRKEKLAAWVIAPDNPYFARAAVNRLWGQFLGHGLVHPVDDLSDKNTPSHPELLQTLAEQFVAHQYDLKWLVRELVNSQTYQAASTGTNAEALPRWFERARVRPLSAEEMLASWRVATGFDAVGGSLPSGMQEYVVRAFGEPTTGRGDFQPGLSEHLFANNSTHLRQLIQPRKGNLAETLLKMQEPWEERVERLFLTVLTRPPRPQERERFARHFASGGKTEPLIEDAIWALLNASEFRFNR